MTGSVPDPDAALDQHVDADLSELARAYGVAAGYHDWQGNEVVVSASAVRAVLAALGVDAATPAAAEKALQDKREEPWRRVLAPCFVTRRGSGGPLLVHVPAGEHVDVWVELEGESTRVDLFRDVAGRDPSSGEDRLVVDGRTLVAVPVPLPGDLSLGWHRLHAEITGAQGRRHTEAILVVTPPLVLLPARLGEKRAWGFMTQLYQLRSARSWGLGDLADLADLAGWSAREHGAGFVLVNPLHAAEPIAPMTPSPYLPTTRRFVNPVYLRVEAVPEYAYLGGADREEAEQLSAALRDTNSSDAQLDRDAVWQAKRRVLECVHAVARSVGREGAFAAFRRREGQGLTDFAVWCALAEVHGLPWQAWPGELHDPRGDAVARAAQELAHRVDFHCWLQWLLDEQLADVQRCAVEAGMPVGVVHDLAVGVHPAGADAWALGDALARGVTVGAPPDAFNQQGQDWSQPPWRPDRLAELAYAPYRDMLRTILRSAGGIRVDHVMGLFRLWWVPRGLGPAEGTYVRYDAEALVGILALEAHRAGALVVGEDLGVVEPGVRAHLEERGILGTSILWFERDATGQPLAPQAWRELCLATVATHDLPPTAGYLTGEHLRVRVALGLLTRSPEDERAHDARDQQSVMRELRANGLLPGGPDEPAGEQETVEALHRFLTRTPARLIGVMVADAVGDRRGINQPGTEHEYPNWRLPLADGAGRPVVLDELVDSDRARALADVVGGAL